MDRVREIVGRLSGLGGITSKSLFGGHGLYCQGVIFGIVDDDRLYLKVDPESRPIFEARGMGPFRPTEKQTLRSYYEVPREDIGDPDRLLAWAKEAIRASRTTPRR